MKDYVETLIEQVEEINKGEIKTETKGAIKKAKEVLYSYKFIQQRGIRSLVDKDARVCRKTKTDRIFFDSKKA